MYIELGDKYRMQGRSLYLKSGDAFIHCAVVPARIRWLGAAIKWFEAQE